MNYNIFGNNNTFVYISKSHDVNQDQPSEYLRAVIKLVSTDGVIPAAKEGILLLVTVGLFDLLAA